MRFKALLIFMLTPVLMAQTSEGFKPLPLEKVGTYVSNGGADRCAIEDCLCKVSPGLVKKSEKVRTSDRRVSVYFDPNSSKPQTYKELQSFVKSHDSSIFTVIGYTDGCGTMAHNTKLARSRVKSIKARMSKMGAKITAPSLFKPEVTDRCSAEHRRVDIIAHTKSRLTTMIDKIPADVYLIDASGSMWGAMRNWSDVVSASFKPHSRIYLSKTSGCTQGQVISEVTPSGGTEIWYSYWRVIDEMNEGETLAIISDFVSDVPLTVRESITIQNKVASKMIKVIAIQL